jgi:hypothetical protein
MEYSFKKVNDSNNPYSDNKANKSHNFSGFQDQTMAQTSDFKSLVSDNSNSGSQERPVTKVTNPIQYEEVQGSTDRVRVLQPAPKVNKLMANQEANRVAKQMKKKKRPKSSVKTTGKNKVEMLSF